MITTGVDSYITVHESEELLRGHKLYDPYLALPELSKERLLKEAVMRIDSLPFSGRKYGLGQKMAFPRNGSAEIPYRVKMAQAIEAACVLDSEAENRRLMAEQGVRSVTLGKVSESYSENGNDVFRLKGLRSRDAYMMLRMYLLGSAPIV